jgi:hypothetical protein
MVRCIDQADDGTQVASSTDIDLSIQPIARVMEFGDGEE